MLQLAIRCHPCVPVSADELEPWLEQQLDELRADAPHGTLRLSRLTQGAPDLDLEIGWLVELDLPEVSRCSEGGGLPTPSGTCASSAFSQHCWRDTKPGRTGERHDGWSSRGARARLGRRVGCLAPRARCHGAERDAAMERLHALLLRAAVTEVARRRSSAAVAAGDLDDLANQAADDALMAVLRKLHSYRGDSRFTTWAYKFALLEAAAAMRRRPWHDRELPLEADGWARFPRAGRLRRAKRKRRS